MWEENGKWECKELRERDEYDQNTLYGFLTINRNTIFTKKVNRKSTELLEI